MPFKPFHHRRRFKKVLNPILWRGLFASVLFGSYILSVLPGDVVAPLFAWSDKLNHAAAFLVLSFLMRMGWKIDYFKVVALLIFYGVFIEFSQLFAVNRSAEFEDIIADTVGIFIGLRIHRIIMVRF